MLVALSLALAALPAPLQQAAPQDGAHLTRLVRRAGSGVRWMADPYRRWDLRRGGGAVQPYSPPIDRNELLDEALARAKREKRIVLAYVWRIEGRQMYRAPIVDEYMRLGVWSDPELVALVNRKFVPLRLYADRTVAKRLGVFNADPKDELFLAAVEPAVFFLDPKGKVLHRVDRIRTYSSYWMRHVLEQVLRKHAVYDAPSRQTRVVDAKDDADALVWVARQQTLDGDEEEALATLAKAGRSGRARIEALRAKLAALEKAKPDEKDPAYRIWTYRLRRAQAEVRGALARALDYHLARAQALRLARRGKEALAVLDDALATLGTEAGAAHAFWLEQGRCHIALGDVAAAASSLAGAGRSSEAEWLRGVCDWLKWRTEEAKDHFRAAVALGEAPFSWRAAAMVAAAADTTPFSPLAHGYELVGYGPDRAYEGGLPATTELPRPGSPGRAKKEVVRAAFDFLLSEQRPDGSWADSRYVWSGVEILPNVHVAVTAIAATALLAWRDLDPQRVDAALRKAETYLRDDRRLAFGREEEVYSHCYRMLYWVRKTTAHFGETAENFANIQALAKRAAAIQDKETGFFAHEYPNAFCTGAMMWSLYLAKSIGVDIDDDMIRLGVKALLSARRKDGSFSYGGTARQRDASRGTRASITHLKDASARMPVCEAVLHAFGSSDRARVTKAFRTFLTYLDRIARVRKCDFHTDGQLAGFFFWHAMFHTSEAKVLVGEGLRRKVEKRLLDLVTSFPEIDGSFVDSHELGKSYGTAMALLVLANLPAG